MSGLCGSASNGLWGQPRWLQSSGTISSTTSLGATSAQLRQRHRSSLRRVLLGTTSIAVLGLLLITTKPTRATDWNGNNSTDWFTAGNWSAGVPTGLDSAAIDTVTPNATVVGAAGAVANGVVVGSSGTGMLAIQNSGTLGSGPGTIGNNGGSIGTATVTGAGSSWTVPSILVGQAGTGTLIIEHGGAMNVIAGGAGIIGSGSRNWHCHG